MPRTNNNITNISQSNIIHDGTTDEEWGAHQEPQFSFWITVAFTVNYVVGTGFLTLPWAFNKSGVFLGVVVMFILAFFAIIACGFIIETMARGNYIYEKDKETINNIDKNSSTRPYQSIALPSLYNKSNKTIRVSSYDKKKKRNIIYNKIHDNDKEYFDPDFDEELDESTLTEVTLDEHTDKEYEVPIVKNKKFEMIELCNTFLGPTYSILFSGCCTIYLYGTLWAYSTVFSNAFCSHVTIGA